MPAAASDTSRAVPTARVVDQLEQRSLVTRARDGSDRRRVWLSLTPAGRRSMRRLERAGATAEQELLSRLTEEERTQLHDLLLRLTGLGAAAAEEESGLSDDQNRERAERPEDLGRMFIERANAGDVEGLVALYEPEAVVALPPGRLTRGREAIRRAYRDLLEGRPSFSGEQRPALRNGDLAFTSTRFQGGVTAEVARRQPDGTWLWAIDQPNVLR
jgi:ketosteroid isomerase-like protein